MHKICEKIKLETEFASPRGLTGLSALLRREFEEVPAEVRAVLRFEDLDAVLEATDTESLRDLLNVVCEMSRVHGVEACYHLDPDGVNEGRIAEVKEAFDEVVGDESDTAEEGSDGTETVRVGEKLSRSPD